MKDAASLYHLPTGERNTAVGIFFSAALAVAGIILAAIWSGTEYVAYRFGFAAALGAPIVRLPDAYVPAARAAAVLVAAAGVIAFLYPRVRARARGLLILGALLGAVAIMPIYAPFNCFAWWWRMGETPGTAEVWRNLAWIITIPSHLAFVGGILVAVRRAKRIGGHSDLHGSAHWASRAELADTGLVGNSDGPYVGAFEDDKSRLHYLRHDGPQNVLCFAPSRSGKGVGLVIPTLLSWAHSVVVNDIKGENWALTAGWRQQELGSVCLKFDPTSPVGSARYNPLLEVRPWPDEVKDAQNIVEILTDPDGDSRHDHWDLTAADLLTGLILHVLYAEPEKTLTRCLHVLANPSQAIENTLSKMLTTRHDPGGRRGWKDGQTGEPTEIHPVVAGAARALLNKSDNERSSVISSAIKFLNLYRDPIIAANTATSDFTISDLVNHEHPVSLYLTTPPSDISRTRPLARLLINQIGRRLTEKMLVADQRGPLAVHRLLFMLDEFPSLGRLDFFQSALAYLPGYGIQAYVIAQDLSQLYAAYGRDESIVSNCHVRIAYAPNKIETAKLLSDMAGTMTVFRETRSYTGNRLAPFLFHVIASEQESQRPLLTPDEALRLPEDVALIFVAGHPPIYGRKIRYFVDPTFRERSAISPPGESGRIEHDWTLWTTRQSEGAEEAGSKPVPQGHDLLPDEPQPPTTHAPPGRLGNLA